jgi:hypothetical protein
MQPDYGQVLTDLLPLKIRDAGHPAGPTTAADHREIETVVISAIAFLQSMTRGNRIFSDELFDATPGVDGQEGDLFLDRTGNLALWGWIDGEWVWLGELVGAAGAAILGGAGAPPATIGRIGDWYFQYDVAAWERTAPGWQYRFGMGAGATVPSQVGQAGKYLATNGSVVSWQAVPAGYSDNQAKDAALQSIPATSTLTATYNTTTRLLSLNLRAASVNMTHLDPAILATGTLTPTQQGYLSNTANWSGKAYMNGPILTGIPSGTVFQDATYFYYFYTDNQPLRMALV